MPACNLHFGLLCLRNALALIPENIASSANDKEKDQKEKENTDSDSNNHE